MPTAVKSRRTAGQKAKGPVSPKIGLRLRELRLMRGLTQSELARAGSFSKALISLIETGRTRMSLLTAEKLAARLDVSVGDLLAAPVLPGEARQELALVRAESELRAGRPEGGLTLSAGLEGETTGVLRARVQRLRGRALNATSHSREAIRLLDEAIRGFRAGGDRDSMIRTLYDLAVAHGRLDQQGESLNLALECERALRDGQLTDRSFELTVLAYIAAKFVALGDFEAADLRAERAKAIAEDIGDPRGLATLYAALATTREEQGDLEGALRYARRALEVEEILGIQADIASSWNTIAWVQVRRGGFTKAEEALTRAERLGREAADGRLLAHVQQTRAELAHARGRYEEAVALASESIANASASDRCRAFSLLVRAQALAKTAASLAEVDNAFAAALTALDRFGRRQLGRAHRAHFEALLERGESEAANRAAQKALEFSAPALA